MSCGFNLGTEIEKSGKKLNRNLFFDMGVLYKITNNQIAGDHSIAVAVQNVLSSSVQRKMWHSQPVNTKVSWWAHFIGKRITAGFDFYVENCMSENPEISYLSNLGLNRYPLTVNVLAGREYAGGSFGYSLTTPGLHEFSLLTQYVRNIRQHSPAYPFITLTLLQIAIEGHSEEDIVKYQKIFQDSIKKYDSLKQEVDFLVAEYKFVTNEMSSALNKYSKLKPGHPLYRAAQYSMASIYFYQKNQIKLNEVISELQKHKTDNDIDQINRLRSISPIPVEKFKSSEDSIKKERLKIQDVYDTIGFAIDNAFKSNQSMLTIRIIDSLQVIQKKCFEIIEKDRLLQNALYKKWQILGNELLKYLNKDELEVLEKCQKIVGERN